MQVWYHQALGKMQQFKQSQYFNAIFNHFSTCCFQENKPIQFIFVVCLSKVSFNWIIKWILREDTTITSSLQLECNFKYKQWTTSLVMSLVPNHHSVCFLETHPIPTQDHFLLLLYLKCSLLSGQFTAKSFKAGTRWCHVQACYVF